MAKPIITGMDGYTIGARISGCVIDGLWFAGAAGVNGEVQSIQAGSNAVVRNCVFINLPEAIDGLMDNTLVENCIFINCGWGRFSHSVYYNNDAAVTGHTLQDCIFIGGQAYHIHLWHSPANITIQRNFSAASEWAMVCNGDGHVVQNNFIWSGFGKTGEEQLTWNFSAGDYQYVNNYAGQSVILPGTVTAGVDSNTFYGTVATFGTNPVSKSWADFATDTTYTKAQIDNAIAVLDAAKLLTPAQLVDDTTIATNAAIIRDMMSKVIE
jgi:hypothetical protein